MTPRLSWYTQVEPIIRRWIIRVDGISNFAANAAVQFALWPCLNNAADVPSYLDIVAIAPVSFIQAFVTLVDEAYDPGKVVYNQGAGPVSIQRLALKALDPNAPINSNNVFIDYYFGLRVSDAGIAGAQER